MKAMRKTPMLFRRYSSSTCPGSSELCCQRVWSQGASPQQEPRWLLRLDSAHCCCLSSRCWCGWTEGAPTHGRSCGNGHRHGANGLQGGNVRAHRDGHCCASAASRRCHRTCGNGGDVGRSQRALGRMMRSTPKWNYRPRDC